jgi:2-oxoglutarate dehydrogenase E2 component (dihydrolipoamide succinyltransferase)
MSLTRSIIAKRLKASQNTAAMLTTFQECDMSAVIELREKYKEEFQKRHGVKLGFMSFFVKAAATALLEFPIVNAGLSPRLLHFFTSSSSSYSLLSHLLSLL